MIDKVARFCYNDANNAAVCRFSFLPTNFIRIRTTLLEHKKEGAFAPPVGCPRAMCYDVVSSSSFV